MGIIRWIIWIKAEMTTTGGGETTMGEEEAATEIETCMMMKGTMVTGEEGTEDRANDDTPRFMIKFNI